MGKLAILAAGGPAPGINSVIGAATIRAQLSGVDVLGVRDGYSFLMRGLPEVVPLSIAGVSRIHYRGGSHIGISREGPASDPEALDRVIATLTGLGVDQLISVGGDGSQHTAQLVHERSAGRLRVVHVPKTIDNDIDLPEGAFTFGFQTARHVGVNLLRDLQVDAKTTSRWYLLTTMGRHTGHLALGIGKAGGATLTIIPEEFEGRRVSIERLVDVLVTAIVKRLADGRRDGVAVLAEGLIDCIDAGELEELGRAAAEHHGHVRFDEFPLGEVLKTRVLARLRECAPSLTVVAKNVGYELRCTDPIPFDMEYARDLGYCASKYLLEGGAGGVLIAVVGGVFRPIPFGELIDPATGRPRVRRVDIATEHYRIARRYMIRLRRDDLENDAELGRFAAVLGLTIDEFRRRFAHLVEGEPPPIRFGGEGATPRVTECDRPEV